jgi:hypothetical protein
VAAGERVARLFKDSSIQFKYRPAGWRFMSERSTLAFLALLLVGAAGFSGCMDNGGDAPTPEADAAAAQEQAAVDANATVDDGTAEMPKDLGAKPHAHDYWTGKERITLLDQDVQVDPFTAVFFSFVNVIGWQTPAVGGAFVQLPDGAIVFEGTGKLEFTATWSEPTMTGMTLRYRSAASTEFSEPVALGNGEILSLDVSPEMSDMPHEKTSRWTFLLSPGSGQTMIGSFHAKVDIVKMRDIESFPGHPELFNGASTLTLYEGPATSSQTNFAVRAVTFVTAGGGVEEEYVRPTAVVPMETMAMTANVTITSAAASVGKVNGAFLLVKPANSNGFRVPKMIASDPDAGTYQFAWLVDMEQTDSPYAKTSQWGFDLRVSTDPTGTGQQCGGCSDAQVDYTLVAVAYDAPVEGAEALDGGRGQDDDDG